MVKGRISKHFTNMAINEDLTFSLSRCYGNNFSSSLTILHIRKYAVDVEKGEKVFMMTLEPNTDQVVILKEFEKRIVEVFEVFDHTGNKTIDVREIPTVLSSLGCVPSKNEINEIIANVQEPESHGNVHISKFLPLVSNLIVNYRFHPASAEELLRAFQILDKNGRGYLTKDYLSKIMTERGENFTQEELNEMMSVAVNSENGDILYETYLNHIMVSIYV